MKTIEIKASVRNDIETFHMVTIQADQPEEPEMLRDAVEEYPDVTMVHAAYPLPGHELPNVYLILFWAKRDITGDIPALIASIEAEFQA